MHMKKFSDIFHKLFSKKSKPAYTHDVVADWQKIVVFFCAGFLVVGGVSLYFFLKLNNGDIFTAGKVDPSKTQIMSTKQLFEINAHYDKKEERVNSISTTTEVTIDPSR
jgi:hypothetical protein